MKSQAPPEEEKTMKSFRRFEFRVFPADEDGCMDTTAELREITDHEDRQAAKSRGGSLAKRYNGPVDIAYAGNAPWADRYITTASPSKYHSRGYRFERIA
jgi:hypothetical protein